MAGAELRFVPMLRRFEGETQKTTLPCGEVVTMLRAKMHLPGTNATRMVNGTLFINAFLARGWVIIDDAANSLPDEYQTKEHDAVPEEPEVEAPPQVEEAAGKVRRGRPRGSKNGRRP